MKEKVLKLIIKWGQNKETAEQLVNESIDIALKMYPDARPAKIAEVITYI